MSDIKYGFGRQLRKEQEFRASQEIIKNRHGISDENVIVVEKKSLIRYLLKGLASFIRIAFQVIFILLSAIGIISLMYDGPRQELIKITLELKSQLF